MPGSYTSIDAAVAGRAAERSRQTRTEVRTDEDMKQRKTEESQTGGQYNEDMVNALGQRIRDLEKSATEAEANAEHYKRKVQRRDETIAELQKVGRGLREHEEKELDKCRKQLSKTVEELEQVKKVRDRYGRVGQNLHEQNTALKASYNSTKADFAKFKIGAEQAAAKLQMDLHEQELLVKEMQEDVYKVKNTDGWALEPDSKIGAALDSLERAIMGFCQEHATKTKGVFTLGARFRAEQVVAEQLVNTEGMKALEDGRLEKKAAGLLLSAWLTQFVYSTILGKPFFFVDNLELQMFTDKGTWIGAALRRLLAIIKFGTFLAGCNSSKLMIGAGHGRDHKLASSVRSEILRALYAPHDTASAQVPVEQYQDFQSSMGAAIKYECEHLTKEFVAVAQTLTSIPESKEMLEDIENIMLSAAQLSQQLSVQRCSLVIDGLSKLPEKFDASSKYMEAHKTYDADLEDEPTCLDGKDILLVTNPLVMALGSSDGSEPSTIRVLKKARVWMGKI